MSVDAGDAGDAAPVLPEFSVRLSFGLLLLDPLVCDKAEDDRAGKVSRTFILPECCAVVARVCAKADEGRAGMS